MTPPDLRMGTNHDGLRPPGPPSWSPFGHFPDFARDQLGFLTRSWQEYGDLVAFRFGWRRVYLVAHPEGVRQVLQGYPNKYDKRLVSYQRMRRVIGDGLVTSGGDLWKQHRQLAQPAFDHRRIHSFAPLINCAARQTASRWIGAANAGEPLDIHAEMNGLTLRVASMSLLGIDTAQENNDVGRTLETALSEFMHRLYSVVPVPEMIPTPRNRRFRRAKKQLDRIVQSIITARRGTGGEIDDLLSRLIGATDPETGIGMGDGHLRDQVVTILIAGQESTANALTWTWHLLARHPDSLKRLEAELCNAPADRDLTADDMQNLPYTSAVLQESMRLYPPVPLLSRRTVDEDVVMDHIIPKGSIVVVSPFITHRHPEFWEDPHAFRPERFLEVHGRARFAFFPFGGGPRICIGASFAMLEATMLLAILARQFRLRPLNDAPVECEATVRLRPRFGLPMVLSSR
jgi:cytochrome P450